MYHTYHAVGLLLLGLGISRAAVPDDELDQDIFFNTAGNNRETFYSGDRPDDDDIDEDFSGSGHYEITNSDCQQHLIASQRKQRNRLHFDFIPVCNDVGGYEVEQCERNHEPCWCVNFQGKEIPNTRVRQGRANCRRVDRTQVVEDLIFEEKPGSNVGNGNGGSKGSDEYMFETDPPNTNNGEEGVFKEEAEISERNGFLAQPLILAGIIAFAVVCLLCAVLLVMFIVYRMRKKDEGSYALDEPKRSPSHPYQRAPTKEYFA